MLLYTVVWWKDATLNALQFDFWEESKEQLKMNVALPSAALKVLLSVLVCLCVCVSIRRPKWFYGLEACLLIYCK